MTATAQRLTVNNATLAYNVHGAAEGKPALVFVHGYAMQSSGPTYRSLLAPLAKDFSVYALDLRGHGGSAGATAGWSLEALADDVAGFAEQLGLAGATYVGHSIGGFTGMYAAIRHPGVFSALCLVTTAAASGGGHAPPEAGTVLIEHSRDHARMIDHFGPMYLRASREEVVHAADSIGLMDRSVHETFFATYPDCVITKRLAEIRVPVLVLSGAQDIIVPPAEQHLTALGLPLCKEVTYSDEGHMMPMEAPETTAREIRNFRFFDVPEMGGRV